MTFEKDVKIALIKKDWTQTELANQMGISVSYLRDLLSGSRVTDYRIDQIKKLLKEEMEQV